MITSTYHGPLLKSMLPTITRSHGVKPLAHCWILSITHHRRMGIMKWHQTFIRTHHQPKGVNEMVRNTPTEARILTPLVLS